MIAEVAVSGLLYTFDRPFDYLLGEFSGSAAPGCRVSVGFGQGNKRRTAMILSLREGEGEGLKEIQELIDERPVIGAELLALARSIAEKTFCCIYDACRLMFPAGLDFIEKVKYQAAGNLGGEADADTLAVLGFLGEKSVEAGRIAAATGVSQAKLSEMAAAGAIVPNRATVRRVGDRTERLFTLSGAKTEKKPTPKQQAVIQLLEERAGKEDGFAGLSGKEISYFTGVGISVVNGLFKAGVLSERMALRERRAFEVGGGELRDPEDIRLEPEQQQAFLQLLSEYEGGKKGALLFGVTGSGKTMILIKLLGRVLAGGRRAIVMLPEILLTPQFIKLFAGFFGDRVAVIHSGLSDGVRLDEYRRIKDGRADIVIGTRSAVFAPMDNIGLISMDEEQESAYKSESAPRYDAGEVARMRAAYHGALMLRMSATPSIKSRYLAEEGRLGYVSVNERYGSAVLPEVSIVDMGAEETAVPGGMIGVTLAEALKENYAQGRQSVVLLNRRGHDNAVICFDCGEVIKCPRCSVALNYHSANGRMMCHYCGHSQAEKKCLKCGGTKMRFFGSGTQKLEKELEEILPQAAILRMDTDSTMTKEAHDRLFYGFAEGEYDLLIGTQMVAKGLDFENVTLAAVLNAEQGLFSGDFKGAERTFSLLTQVVGRCGRGRFPGRAVLQTYMSQHWIIELARQQDYESFYRGEIELRRQMMYPPFCDICLFGISAADPGRAAEAAARFMDMLREAVGGTDLPIRAFGPAPAGVFKVSDRYRYRITLKCRNNARFREMVSLLLKRFLSEYNNKKDGVSVFADINPEQYF